MREAYAQVIDVLTCGDVDYKSVAIALAKACPEVFMEIVGGKHTSSIQNSTEYSKFNAEILHLMQSNQKVSAVKKCREVTGMGLKEAKDYVEDIEASRPVKMPLCFDGPVAATHNIESIRNAMAKALTGAERVPKYAGEGEFQ